jgi:hypothetical protein
MNVKKFLASGAIGLVLGLPSGAAFANPACTGFNNCKVVGISLEVVGCTAFVTGYVCLGANSSYFSNVGSFTIKSPECQGG